MAVDLDGYIAVEDGDGQIFETYQNRSFSNVTEAIDAAIEAAVDSIIVNPAEY
jgi:hypothetical protein